LLTKAQEYSGKYSFTPALVSALTLRMRTCHTRARPAASIASEAVDHGLNVKSKFTITPGFEQVRATIMIERDGQIGAFEAVDGVALANACGPYIG
jgi:aconitase A